MALDVLEAIAKIRRDDIASDQSRLPLNRVKERLRDIKPPRDFFGALRTAQGVALIAEMKRSSPSAGSIREEYDPAAIAKSYEAGGAAALSVLTEPHRFEGAWEHISQARMACALPVLCKDFVVDPYQIYRARMEGADAILLIADLLSPAQLIEWTQWATETGVEPLVEVFTEGVIPAALACGARLIGINTRNLRTLQMNADNVARLKPLIPGRFIVAESGIQTPEDVKRVQALGVVAMLVGESLMRQPDVTAAARQLVEAGR